MISSPFKLPSKMSPNVLYVSEVAEVNFRSGAKNHSQIHAIR